MIKKSSNAAKQLNGNLQDIAWLLEDEGKGLSQPKAPNYGDVTELNTERTILDSVGRETLKTLAEDIMSLLDTSVAVYEKNGDYAYGSFVSEWCSLMDGASRELCNTGDNRKALDCGRWLCHENCWNDSAKAAMESGKITDIACVGGIRLYSVPIIASGNIIGVINMGHGNPPTDEKTQKELSRTFGCDRDSMRKAAKAFNPRPPFLIDIAKKRLQSIAVQIGRTVEAAQNEKKLKDVARFPEENRNPVLRVDNEMRLLYANPAAMKLMVEPGTNVGDKIPAQWHSLVKEALSKKAPMIVDVTLHDKVYSFSSTAISDRGYINVYATDITARKQAEEQLKFQADVIENSPIIAAYHNKDLNIIWVNKAYQKATGLSLEEARGRKCYQVWNLSEPCRGCPVLTAIETGENAAYELTPNNQDHWPETQGCWLSHATPVRDEQGTVIGALEYAINVTERKQAEAALQESEARYRRISDELTDYFYNVRIENGRAVETRHSESCFGVTGYSEKEYAADPYLWHKMIVAEDRDMVVKRAEEIITGSNTNPVIHRLIRKDGEIRWMCDTPILHKDDSGKILSYDGIVKDITERKQAEEAVRKNREWLIETTMIAKVGGWTIDIMGNTVEWTEETFRIHELPFGVPPNVTEAIEFYHPEDRPRVSAAVQRSMETGEVFNFEARVITARKNLIWVSSIGHPIFLESRLVGLQGTVQDITDRKRMEEELQKAQRLESLGLLAGGIAHDFNNLMGGIFGYIDMANEETKETKVTSYLSKAMNTIDRARALTQQLLTFAKGGAPIQQIGQLFPFVEETAKFALSGANVSCNFVVPQDLWACNFDKNQIGQVIDNLIINAQQAMPVGGTIDLAARNITLSEKEHPLLVNGNYVKISVKDTGVGIPKEHISKIFDPFFTTKAKGHGLGLATCYSIINRHGGCIDVESEPGKGSTFKVYLPASTEAAFSVTRNTAKTHKGSGTFLVMDDEEVMMDTISDMLGNLGYTVVGKENGKDALSFFAAETKANRTFAGMIFDLTVPGGMGGKEAIEEIRKTNPDIPAFVASGYADDPVMKNPTEYGFMASICKPFRKSELSEMLNKYMRPKK